MEMRGGVGCRMGGLRQACARTIHGYYILGLKIPFYVCVLNCYCMRRHGKAYEYDNDVRYVWYEQQQQRQYREFCSF